jgi:hypothetical protein
MMHNYNNFYAQTESIAAQKKEKNSPQDFKLLNGKKTLRAKIFGV